MDKLSDECRDLEDTKEARDAMEKAIGAEVYEKAEDEIKQTTNAQNKLGCKFIKSYSFNLPETGISIRFYIFERNKKLSKTYPRQAGKPKKNPL